MSLSCRAERSLISHEEHEIVQLTHHPAIYEVEPERLQATRKHLRALYDKERTLGWQKRRSSRGKADERGGSFPGTIEGPARRKQVFASAVKRINKELMRMATLKGDRTMSGLRGKP